MEENNLKLNQQDETKTKQTKKKKGNVKIPIIILVVAVIAIIGTLIITSKGGNISIKVKSSLTDLVEKSDLETLNVTYNVIAKKCKNEEKCDKTSNKIKDFDYVVSCKGTITLGIDFKDVKIQVDEKNKKVIVEVPEAAIKGEPNISSIKFLNGDSLGASELTNATKLCQETTKEKSNTDKKLMPAAKEQAKYVLEGFYNQWIKAYDSSYVIEVR